MELWKCDLCSRLYKRERIDRYRYESGAYSYEMNVCDNCISEDMAVCEEEGVSVELVNLNDPDDYERD